VLVRVHGEADRGVSEGLARDLRVNARRQQSRRVGMPQIIGAWSARPPPVLAPTRLGN
jgi:hypothetical protein